MADQYSKFKAGIYRHYKGPLYLVLGLAHDSNDESRTAVVYIALQLDAAKAGPRLAIRTYEDFYTYINPKNGEKAAKSSPGAKPRFKYIGSNWDPSLK